MNIAGLGIVFNRGRGVASLERALEEGWRPPVSLDLKGVPGLKAAAYPVAPETLDDKAVLAKARRADRFTRMALLSAFDAWTCSRLGQDVAPSRVGVILATALGPHVTTFGFLDGILDFGDAAVSPTAFSHSVHNAAASYIAMTLGLRGPTLTVTDFHFAFHEAARLANLWLDERRCDAVLVGTVDELGHVMQAACARLLAAPEDGRIKPFAFAREAVSIPGEGSVFFAFAREPPPDSFGALHVAAPGAAPAAGLTHCLLEADGLIGDESRYANLVAPGAKIGAYAPLFGSIMTGSAFHAAVAALMVKGQREYACPVPADAPGVSAIAATKAAAVGAVASLRLNCAGALRSLVLSR